MNLESLKRTNEKLAENPELSKHNKKVLNDFFRSRRTSGTGESTLGDYASRFNTLAPHISFKLDEAEREDIEVIINKINRDEINKHNGEAYSDHTKEKFWKTLSVFYRKFIQRDGRGYKEDINGKMLLDGEIGVKTDIDHNIDIDTRPTPEHIQKVSEQASSLRDKALIMFGWATGARIGEITKTPEKQQYPEPLTWRDIQFKEKEMHVTLRGKTGKRKIAIRTSMPLMKQLQNKEKPDLDDPVFLQHNPKIYCPECDARSRLPKKSKGENRTSHNKRIYSCKECEWQGKHNRAVKKKKAVTDAGARKTVKRLINQAKNKELIPERITHKPHWVWRDARALYWTAKDRNENFLRAFFGWSKTSDAPKHYIELMNESVLAGVREDFGEELSDEEKKFNQNLLKPCQCKCGEWVSDLQSYCTGCGEEIDEELRKHNNPEPDEETQEIMEEARGLDYTEDEFREIVRGVMDTMKS